MEKPARKLCVTKKAREILRAILMEKQLPLMLHESDVEEAAADLPVTSVYRVGDSGVQIMVVTSEDRGHTMMLLPEEKHLIA